MLNIFSELRLLNKPNIGKNRHNTQILSEASQFNSALTCRNVKYIRELLFDVEDMDNLFKMEKVEDFFCNCGNCKRKPI